MIALVDLGVGVLIIAIAALILGVGLKLLREASKSDKE